MENSSPNPSFSICDIRIQKRISRSFGKSFPQKIVLPKLRPHCSATCPNTWRAEPRKKNTLSFFKRNFTPAKSERHQKGKECFSFGVAEALRGSGGTIHSRSKKVRANAIMTPPNETLSELRIWSDFAGAKIALLIFSKPFPPTAEAVNSQSSPQLHE
jgi:hypothetical protein